jgi:hypothetical protein
MKVMGIWVVLVPDYFIKVKNELLEDSEYKKI